ncbi:MAG TPA: tetratricopeptide repeat protein [Methanothrix sp.]|nr:tetratricopeptide repeat protein [Methanothrix sp.]
MDQLVVLQEIFESYMRGGFSRAIDPKSISGDCANLVAALLESFEEGEIDEKICIRLLNCLSDLYDIKRLGDICRLAGHLGIAARCYNKALSQTADQHIKSVLYNNLGQVHARQGYLGRALHYYQLAMEGFSALGDVGSLAQVLGNMGSAYRSGQSYEEALESCRKSLEIFRSLEDEFGVAQMTGSLGRIYAEMGEFDLALQNYEKSLADFEGLGDQRQVAWILNRMGRVNAEIKAAEAAIGYYNRSMEIFEEIGQHHNAGVVLSNLGRLHLDQGDYDLAADHLETSLDLINKSMQPVRANAVSWLSAVRSIQAKELHQQALHHIGGDALDRGAEELFIGASTNYAAAADCYAELAATPGLGQSELELDAGMARFASALVILELETDPERAVKLAEEGISAINAALSKAEDETENPSVEALRRSMMGMKETWRLTLAKDEPWKLIDVVADAAEHFNQAILQLGPMGRGCKEACGQLLPAFKTLARFMTAMLKGDPPPDLSETAAYLRRAESAFELAAPDLGMISPFQIREARLITGDLEELSRSGKGGSGLILETYQRVLLLLGRVLTRAALTEAADLEVVRTWNESMNLIEESPLGKKSRSSLSAERRRGKVASNDPEADAVDRIVEEEERRAGVRPLLIRPVEDVLSTRGGASVGEFSGSGGLEGLFGFGRTRPKVPGKSVEVETASKAEGDWRSEKRSEGGSEGAGEIKSGLKRGPGDEAESRPSTSPPGRSDADFETEPAPALDSSAGASAGAPVGVPAGAPSSVAGDLKAGRACDDLAALGAIRSSHLRSVKRFASVIGSDLAAIGPGRAEFRTPRLQRTAYGPLLRSFAWRGLRLFMALVFLFLLTDLTHYFI